jgi:hypothetical protein
MICLNPVPVFTTSIRVNDSGENGGYGAIDNGRFGKGMGEPLQENDRLNKPFGSSLPDRWNPLISRTKQLEVHRQIGN